MSVFTVSLYPRSVTRRHVAAGKSQSPGRRRAGSVAIALLLIGITVWALWAIASPILGLKLIVFSTDTMAPHMPIGSIAIVQIVPVENIAVGDVVSVQRAGVEIPVTQRVVETSAGAASRVLTLVPDSENGNIGVRYQVERVGKVVASVPNLGAILMSVDRPIVLTPLISVLVIMSMWVIWPEKRSQ